MGWGGGISYGTFISRDQWEAEGKTAFNEGLHDYTLRGGLTRVCHRVHTHTFFA